MINFDAIFIKFQKIIMERVGPRLSVIPGTTFPAVVRARDAHTIPDYPFITVDIDDVTEGGAWLLNEYIDDNDNTVYEVPKQLSVSLRCYGGTTSSEDSSSSLSICNALQGIFLFEPLRWDLMNTLNMGIVNVLPIRTDPVKRFDTFVEMSYFYLITSVQDEHVDTLTSQLVQQVDYNGALFDGVDDQDDGAPVVFTVIN